MRVKPTVLKLGGSVITRKDKPLTPNLGAIRRLAREVSEAGVDDLIVVHGGGSFGHPIARRYEISRGYTNASQLLGFSKTHQAMASLNKLVVEALMRHNVPAVSVAPSSFIVTKLGRINKVEWRPIARMLRGGFVPVLYGDAVMDSKLVFTILSGDQLVSSLAARFDAKRVVVGVDVDGLYTADPKVDRSAKLLRHVTLEELRSVQHGIEGAKVTDVTGGMLGKVLELMPAIERGVPVVIVNAAKSNKIYKALRGERVIGTLINKGEGFVKKDEKT